MFLDVGFSPRICASANSFCLPATHIAIVEPRLECSDNVRPVFSSAIIHPCFRLSSASEHRNQSFSSSRVTSPLPIIAMLVPTPCLPFFSSLTGLLSFMLSDEMTTGSVTSSDTHKRTYAQRSHGWNLTQARFKEAFPEVSNSRDGDFRPCHHDTLTDCSRIAVLYPATPGLAKYG